MLMHRAFISRRRGLLGLSLGLLLAFLPVNAAFSLDYVIKEVIEVGEADFVPFLGPVKWSPDGTMIAFTKNGVIKVSDTLGNIREVARLDMGVHRMDWVSNDKIAVQLKGYTGQGMATENRLSLIDVTTGIESPVHEYKTTPDYKTTPGVARASGPYKTVEGNLFYTLTSSNSRGQTPTVERKSFSETKLESIGNNHFLRWSDSGLYMVRLDESDSTWLVSKPFRKMGLFTKVSHDLSYALDGGQLFRLRDSVRIVLDTLLGPVPENTHSCDVSFFSFNPVADEVLFTIVCEGGVHESEFETFRIATFDCNSFKLSIIDSLISMSNCVAPAYSPDGMKIAFQSKGKVYFLKRSLN